VQLDNVGNKYINFYINGKCKTVTDSSLIRVHMPADKQAYETS
jgi:hypothetical protein